MAYVYKALRKEKKRERGANWNVERVFSACADLNRVRWLPSAKKRERERERAVCGSCRRWLLGPSLPVLVGVRGPTVEQLGPTYSIAGGTSPSALGRWKGGAAPVNWHRLLHSTPLITYRIYTTERKKEEAGGGSSSSYIKQRGDGSWATTSVGPLSSVDCTRPTTSITQDDHVVPSVPNQIAVRWRFFSPGQFSMIPQQ